MQTVKTGREKQIVYAHEYRRLKKAISEQFYLEAISICYAMIEDRLVAFLHHAGIVSRQNDNLVINQSIAPFIRKMLDMQNGNPIRIKDISVKIVIIQKLLSLSEEKATEIDNEMKDCADTKRKRFLAQKGYLTALQKQMENTVDVITVQNVLSKLDPWRSERNQLIHALLSKTVSSSNEAQKSCAETGKELSRLLDDKLVKPFKSNNRIRKQFNIQ